MLQTRHTHWATRTESQVRTRIFRLQQELARLGCDQQSNAISLQRTLLRLLDKERSELRQF